VHNVKPGARYPATMIVTGENDARVVPRHSYKFAAALQSAQAGPAPILLKVESTSGHGGGTTLAAKARNEADQYAFLARALEMTVP
jgi:prolyl oligopeptidase